MANAQGTGSRPNTSTGSTPATHTPPTSEMDTTNGHVKVYDNEGTTSRAASTSPGSWRDADEDGPRTTTMRSDPAPAARGGVSMVTGIIVLIAIVLIIYFLLQLVF